MFKGRSVAREIIDFAEVKEVGGVELMSFCEELSTPNMKNARELGKRARDKKLALPCFSVGIDAIADPKASLERLKGYAEICSALEIPLLHHTIALDFTCGRLPADERERRFNTGAVIALELADFANRLGVRTVIEDQGYVFNGVELCDRLCRLSDERIGIVADVGNILFVNEDPADFIRAMGRRVLHSHVKDYTNTPIGFPYPTTDGSYIYDCPIGRGILDFNAIGNAFEDIGYGGYYALEFPETDSPDEVDRVLDLFTN